MFSYALFIQILLATWSGTYDVRGPLVLSPQAQAQYNGRVGTVVRAQHPGRGRR